MGLFGKKKQKEATKPAEPAPTAPVVAVTEDVPATSEPEVVAAPTPPFQTNTEPEIAASPTPPPAVSEQVTTKPSTESSKAASKKSFEEPRSPGSKDSIEASKSGNIVVTAPSITLTDKPSKTENVTASDSKKEPLLITGNEGYDPEKGDAEITISPSYRDQQNWFQAQKEAMGKHMEAGPMSGLRGCCASIPSTLKFAALGLGLAALITLGFKAGHSTRHVNVAFIGNSYFYVNDLPRLVEHMADGQMFQDSCLHTSGSILNLLKTGNGMYYKWQTQNAMIGGIEWETEDGLVEYLYDYGACSVPQLLTGHDGMLSYENYYGTFINDGTNPCMMNENYLNYEESYNYTQDWDYIVLTDQAKKMCFDDARWEALLGLNYTYAPILNKIGSTPIVVQPHAYWSENVNMTGLGDVPTFTSMIMEGARIYKEFLDDRISWKQRTKIAKVGDAFLMVYEQDEELWSKLFLSDQMHPSGYGSYLYGLIIHATIYGAMPKKHHTVNDDVMDTLFSTARRMHAVNETQFPTKSEAKVLYDIAQKVAVLGMKPKSYKSSSNAEINDAADQTEEYAQDVDEEEEEREFDDDDYYAADVDEDDEVN